MEGKLDATIMATSWKIGMNQITCVYREMVYRKRFTYGGQKLRCSFKSRKNDCYL